MNLLDEFDTDEIDVKKRRQIKFIGTQLLALVSNRYTPDLMAHAVTLYLRSRNAYTALRELLVLPCRNTIYEYFGKHGLASGLIECERTLRNVFPCYNEGQKCCFISFDEMHIKPGLQYQGKYLIGNALNTDQPLPAKSVLASMINPCFGAPAFVARLIPVLHLKGEFLYEHLISLINLIHEVGGYVFGLMSDNLSVNQKVFHLFHQSFQSLNISSIDHPVPNSKFKMLYTLYDPVHLFKNIRNNWITEKTQTLTFFDIDTNEEVFAYWKDLINIYKSEEISDLKLTKLDYRTLYPNNFEKQKVSLVYNVFNEKTCIALEQQKKTGTENFVKNVTRLWHMLNIRSTSIGHRLNDVDRLPFTDPKDERFYFILKMATIFKQMDNSVRGQRIKGLTSETSNAFHQTLVGIVDLIKTLLSQGHQYVLPGKISSDRTEGEFGIYRQSSGGNFLISAEQVFSRLQL